MSFHTKTIEEIMAMAREYNIAFNKMIKDGEFDQLPNYKGIYMFRVTEIVNNKYYSKVVYIGVAKGEGGLADRINNNHEHINDARKIVNSEKAKGKHVILTISYTDENAEYNDSWERIEAALIFGRKPPINIDGKDSFRNFKTTINISGKRHSDLKTKYIIERKE